MISKKALWFFALAFLGVLAVTHWAGSYPARVVLINQGATLHNVKITSGREVVDIGTLPSGQTRVVKIPSGDYLTVEFDGSSHRRWQSPDKIVAAQSLILNVRNERLEIQRRGAMR